MEARDIIKRPVLTEKSYLLMQENKYTFLVDTRAHKTQIKQAIEEIFGVKVEKVNVMNYKPKFRRVGRYGGYTNKRSRRTNNRRIIRLRITKTTKEEK